MYLHRVNADADGLFVAADQPCLISGMVARAEAPGWISPDVPAEMMLWMILRSWWKGKVHQMGD